MASSLPPTAILFQTHFFDRGGARAFARLAAQCPPHFRPFVLMNLKPGEPEPPRLAGVPSHVVREPEIRVPEYPAKTGGPGWNLWHGGHSDLVALHFFRARPEFERYWVMEYDVRFSGDWSRLFEAVEDLDADFLATALRRHANQPDWAFWGSLRGPEPLDPAAAIACFMPIHRASRAAMAALDAAYRAGWTGHCEGAWPTFAARAGLTLADLGGNGPFTPARLRGRFYSNTPNDLHLAPGSFVFKPALHRVGSRKDMLWHPVKPFALRAELRQGLRDIRVELGALRRKLVAGALGRPATGVARSADAAIPLPEDAAPNGSPAATRHRGAPPRSEP